MKLYRCDLCGRVFSQKTPHKCYGGCFRKLSLTFTEFEDDDYYYYVKAVPKFNVGAKNKSVKKMTKNPQTERTERAERTASAEDSGEYHRI